MSDEYDLVELLAAAEKETDSGRMRSLLKQARLRLITLQGAERKDLLQALTHNTNRIAEALERIADALPTSPRGNDTPNERT